MYPWDLESLAYPSLPSPDGSLPLSLVRVVQLMQLMYHMALDAFDKPPTTSSSSQLTPPTPPTPPTPNGNACIPFSASSQGIQEMGFGTFLVTCD